MPNPPPFPPTAYDTADWVRTTTLVGVPSGGTPASSGSPGPPADAEFGTSFSWSKTPGSPTFFNPGTTSNYTMWHLHVLADIGNITSTATPSRVFFTLFDSVSSFTIVTWNLYWNGATTLGTTYTYDQVFSFPTGYLLKGPVSPANRLELTWAVDIPANWSVGGNNNVAISFIYT